MCHRLAAWRDGRKAAAFAHCCEDSEQAGRAAVAIARGKMCTDYCQMRSREVSWRRKDCDCGLILPPTSLPTNTAVPRKPDNQAQAKVHHQASDRRQAVAITCQLLRGKLNTSIAIGISTFTAWLASHFPTFIAAAAASTLPDFLIASCLLVHELQYKWQRLEQQALNRKGFV